MVHLLRAFAAVFALAALYDPALAAESARTQVLLVGTYHFSNPGKDLNNVKAVDIFAAGRHVHGLDVAGDFPLEAVDAWACSSSTRWVISRRLSRPEW